MYGVPPDLVEQIKLLSEITLKRPIDEKEEVKDVNEELRTLRDSMWFSD